jgi:hypothetical protein
VKSTASILLQIVGALLVVLVLGVGLLMWQFNRPPFDLARLQRLQKGMAQEQVREILGEPRGTNMKSWHYSRAMSCRLFTCISTQTANWRATSMIIEFHER